MHAETLGSRLSWAQLDTVLGDRGWKLRRLLFNDLSGREAAREAQTVGVLLQLPVNEALAVPPLASTFSR